MQDPKPFIDLNGDLGEGFPHDASLFPLISSANIACGGHAGDEKTILHSLALCGEHGVAAGAHPSYPDRENFGRRPLFASGNPLQQAIRIQLDTFFACAEKAKIPVHHVKCHGALYTDCFDNEELSGILLQVLKDYPVKNIYGQSGSVFNRMADALGFYVKAEVFADRAYTAAGKLQPRSEPGALISDPALVAGRVKAFVTQTPFPSVTGELLRLKADTICLHGDNPDAADFARTIRQMLSGLGVSVRA